MIQRALVTGARGFVGTHLTAYLEQAGVDVIAPHHSQGFDAVEMTNIDTVFHLAGLAHAGAVQGDRSALFAANVELTENLYRRACEGEVPQFIWLSSIKVLGDVSANPLHEASPYQPGDLYAESKVAAEQRLLAQASSCTQQRIVRPPLIYGPGVKANFLAMLKWSNSPWPLPLAQARAPRSWLSVANLVDFLVRLANQPELGDAPIFHVKDPQDMSVAEVVGLLRRAAGRNARVWPFPETLAMSVAQIVNKQAAVSRLFRPLQLDSSRSQKLLGWSAPHGLETELAKTMQWYLER